MNSPPDHLRKAKKNSHKRPKSGLKVNHFALRLAAFYGAIFLVVGIFLPFFPGLAEIARP